MNNCVIPQKIANDIFVRHENGGKTTIHSNKLGLKFLNETATMVFDLCTGYNTIEYICDEMQSRFPDVSSDIISDVVLVFCLVFIPLYALIFILLKKHLLAWSINAKRLLLHGAEFEIRRWQSQVQMDFNRDTGNWEEKCKVGGRNVSRNQMHL